MIHLVTGPTSEPVTLAEAKLYCRIDTDDDNTLVESLIESARHRLENLTRRQMMSATYELILDEFPSGDQIELPGSPLVSVTSVAYLDTNGASQTLTVDDEYVVDIKSEPGRIFLPDGETWPSTESRLNTVTITYTNGYASAALVPAPLKMWLLMAVSTMYDNRAEFVVGTITSPLPDSFLLGLIDKYMLPDFA